MKMVKALVIALTMLVAVMILSLVVYAEAPEKECRYELTDSERKMVEFAVFHESGKTGSFAGQMLVAECLLNACYRSDVRPEEAISMYGYEREENCTRYTYADVNESTKDAVSMVFDKGYVSIRGEHPIWFYSPKHMPNHYSAFHESQRFIVELGGHRFFGE